jgi:hypothetical protein
MPQLLPRRPVRNEVPPARDILPQNKHEYSRAHREETHARNHAQRLLHHTFPSGRLHCSPRPLQQSLAAASRHDSISD